MKTDSVCKVTISSGQMQGTCSDRATITGTIAVAANCSISGTVTKKTKKISFIGRTETAASASSATINFFDAVNESGLWSTRAFRQ